METEIISKHLEQFAANYYEGKPYDISRKNKILIQAVENMIKEDGFFNLNCGIIPFEHVCSKCSGTGMRFKFYMRKLSVPCRCCNDTTTPPGYITITCRSCNGTGMYNDMPCKRCVGKGTIIVRCRNCRGNKPGTFVRYRIDSKVKSVTKCQYCNGLGFIPPKHLRPLTQKIGDAIKKNEINSSHTTSPETNMVETG